MVDNNLKRNLLNVSKDKSFEEFTNWLIDNKQYYSLSFREIREICNSFYNKTFSLTFYKSYKKHNRDKIPKPLTPEAKMLRDLQDGMERVKSQDEKNQLRAYVRKLAREDNFKDIVFEAVDEISKIKPLSPYTPPVNTNEDVEGILCLSDWHFGMEFENAWNSYSEDIVHQRVHALRDKVIQKATANNVGVLRVLNLGDMIAGRIHEVIRYESRYDVITQTMKVSEILAELLDSLSRYFPIEYYSCIDNHSNLEPKKDDRLETESLARIIDWYLERRLPQIHINTNKFGLDIITFNCLDHKYLGVHGNLDSVDKVIDSISRMTEDHYDIICTSHRHHFSCDEKNRTVVVANSSLMGTDNYAKERRLSAYPSQNFIVVTRDNPCEAIYRILV